MASLPEIQAGPTNESTEQMDLRGDARNGASERMMLEKSEGEQNEGTSTSAKGRASKKAEMEKRNDNEGDTLEASPKEMPSAGGKKKRAAKQRLVSYSSQYSESNTESRKSSWKRTAVTKMGGVMIDHITRGVVKEKGDK